MRIGRGLFVLFVVLFAMTSGGVRAQLVNERWEFEVTPRFWLMMVNPNSFINSSSFQQSNDNATFPLYGLSLRVAPRGLASDFLLTGFHGTDSVSGRSVNALGASSRHVTDARRTDIELLWRNRVPDSNVLWYIGARWVLLQEDSTVEPGFAFPASATRFLEEETNFYLAEVGLSFSTPLDRGAKHVFFGNITTGVGYESQEVKNRATPLSPDNEGFFPFVDINVGYQFNFSDWASAHLRYRTYALREVVREQMVALHGPEIGFSIKF